MKISSVLAPVLVAGLLHVDYSQADEQLGGAHDRSESFEPGQPGGAVLETEEVLAEVSAIDTTTRSFTLTDAQGHSRTLQAPPQMRNFEQLKVGDRVRAMIGLERIVQLREPGDSSEDGAAGILATAPEGGKPGLLMAETLELTAVIKAMDSTQRTATLQFADGSQRTVKVRPDVEMKPEYLGRELVLRMTSAVAVSVEAQ
ncbi:hypothetical protein ACIGKL_00630 [Pseudomonas sp. NPDC077186]|uniref:hypothetical protein n=1 Tax=Pseudomonas sp. NPDC077186 TaxID=3364421 RepID=UPI0037C8271B